MCAAFGEQAMAETSVRIFISYAHEDEILQKKLAEHLRILDCCTVWTDREITGGEAWNREISRELDVADIILLLLSSSFLSSEFVSKTEIPRALKRHDEKTAKVIPVLGRLSNGHTLRSGNCRRSPLMSGGWKGRTPGKVSTRPPKTLQLRLKRSSKRSTRTVGSGSRRSKELKTITVEKLRTRFPTVRSRCSNGRPWRMRERG